MARKKKPPSLADLGFDEAFIDRVQDLREGFIGAPEHRIIKHAVEYYLDKGGVDAEPEVKRRYEEARDKRVAPKKP